MKPSTKKMKQCKVCLREFTPAGYGQHVKVHLKTGELQAVPLAITNKPGGYPWTQARVYKKTGVK